MIVVNKVSKNYLSCNSCLSNDNIYNITLGLDKQYTMSIRLCDNCKNDLMNMFLQNGDRQMSEIIKREHAEENKIMFLDKTINANLVIKNVMGGTLMLPMQSKMKIKRHDKLEDMEPIEAFKSLITELWTIKEVREILKSYGAKWE